MLSLLKIKYQLKAKHIMMAKLKILLEISALLPDTKICSICDEGELHVKNHIKKD